MRGAKEGISNVPESSLELPASLQRRLGLPLLVLYGTGITVGAGIYVLMGQMADRVHTIGSLAAHLTPHCEAGPPEPRLQRRTTNTEHLA